MALCIKRILAVAGGGSAVTTGRFSAARSYHKNQYEVKVGIPEFLKGIGQGVEKHVALLEKEIGDIQKLLETRTLRLKKIEGISCKQRKLILSFAHKYRLGLWKPRAEPKKSLEK